nr:unnamed protein product [Digitaria exilis]
MPPVAGEGISLSFSSLPPQLLPLRAVLLSPRLRPAASCAVAVGPSSREGCLSSPRCPVVFNGQNWAEFVFHMEVHMGGQQLWDYLTGERPCPPTPTPPTPPTCATDAVKTPLLEAFQSELETYQSDLDAQATWLCEEACAKAILLASMEVDISLSLCGLSTSHLMWAQLRHNYEIRNEALYLAVVEEAQSLRQHDSTIEEFYRQIVAIAIRASGFSRLRPKFEVVRSQLLTCQPRPSLDEALADLRAEETRLQAGGTNGVPQSSSILSYKLKTRFDGSLECYKARLEVCMQPPPGYSVPDGMVYRLRRSLYSLKQAPRTWFKRFSSVITALLIPMELFPT